VQQNLSFSSSPHSGHQHQTNKRSFLEVRCATKSRSSGFILGLKKTEKLGIGKARKAPKKMQKIDPNRSILGMRCATKLEPLMGKLHAHIHQHQTEQKSKGRFSKCDLQQTCGTWATSDGSQIIDPRTMMCGNFSPA
jgi:hypothetical protein